jgi:hypothetical protein
MDAQHLPAMIGLCVHCHLPVYEHAPVAKAPLSSPHCVVALAHVACAVDARRGH